METDNGKKLSELEMLMSIYCKDGEFRMDDISCYTDLKAAVDQEPGCGCSSKEFDRRLRYTIRLESIQKQNRIELTFELPSNYPTSPPDVSVRCGDLLSKESSDKLYSDLQHHIHTNLTIGEPVVLDIVQWAIENIDDHIENDRKNAKNVNSSKDKTHSDNSSTLCRYWIYSHHIYNKNKRRTILESARLLNLNGFSCPGKPGIICIEGGQPQVDEFWQKIRSLQWKKIMLKHQEICEDEGKTWRKFDAFEEMCFQVAGCKDGHTDTSLLLEFLTSKNCQYVFPIYFGINV